MDLYIKTSRMDEKDGRILMALKKNAKFTTSQLSKITGLPITTVHNRIRRMQQEGIIKKYTIVPDYKKLDRGISAYVLVAVTYRGPNGEKYSQEKIAKTIKRMKDVEEVSIVTGETDILIKIRVRDIDTLNDYVIKSLREIEGVDKTKTLIILEEIEESKDYLKMPVMK